MTKGEQGLQPSIDWLIKVMMSSNWEKNVVWLLFKHQSCLFDSKNQRQAFGLFLFCLRQNVPLAEPLKLLDVVAWVGVWALMNTQSYEQNAIEQVSSEPERQAITTLCSPSFKKGFEFNCSL